MGILDHYFADRPPDGAVVTIRYRVKGTRE